jgi:hypothetical protein
MCPWSTLLRFLSDVYSIIQLKEYITDANYSKTLEATQSTFIHEINLL